MIYPYMRGKKHLETLRNLLSSVLISGINIFLVLLVLNLLSLNIGIFEQSFILAFTLYLIAGIILLNLPLKKLFLIILLSFQETLPIFQIRRQYLKPEQKSFHLMTVQEASELMIFLNPYMKEILWGF